MGASGVNARTGLYSLALTEPPLFYRRNAAGGVSARSGDDPLRGTHCAADRAVRNRAVAPADRKVAQGRANVYMYHFE